MREQIIELGRRWQSEQTGFIHLNYADPCGEKHDTIPLVENFLFALALLKSRTVEQMGEARELLHKLLPFQSPEGNFPVYLHEYPQCKELFAAAKILPVLHWIVKDYGGIVGANVKKAYERLIDYCKEHAQQAPKHIAILIASVTNPQALEEFHDEAHWYSPTMLGALIIALQMNPSLEWPNFWSHLNAVWHVKAKKYVAPYFYDPRYQKGAFSKFYEVFMQNEVVDHPYSLYAALIQLREKESISYPILKSGIINQTPFEFYQTEEEASFFAPSSEGTPFQKVWVDGSQTHRLKLKASGSIEKQGDSLNFALEPEDVERFHLALDTDNATRLLVNGEQATVFEMGDTVELVTESKRVSFQISKIEGPGNVLGHVSLEPAKTGYSKRWIFSLRSVAVPESLRISFTV